MGSFKKLTISVGIALTIGVANMSAATYTVVKGDTLNEIIFDKLGFSSIEVAGIVSVPSGDINKIYPGDMIEYTKKHKRNRFKKRKQAKKIKGFCFKDHSSIHYKVTESCKYLEEKAKAEAAKKNQK